MVDIKKMNADQFKDELRNVIMNPGPVPTYHYDIMQKHRREWPSLWAVIDRFIQSQGTTYNSKKLLGEHE